MTDGGAGKILMTGGSGRLGTELRAIMPNLIAPSRAELDITQPATIQAALANYQPAALVHAAAFTDVAAAQQHRQACWQTNVAGTRHVVQACAQAGVFLVHISTDYVFEGTRGQYKEDEPPGPPCNYYALSKLVAEELARLCPRHLVIRTSFRPRQWPYPVAFADVFTSQDYVDVIAPEIALALHHLRDIPYPTLHIATHRKSVYDLARQRKADVQSGSRLTAKVPLPADVSLDITQWLDLKQQWSRT